MQNKKNKIEVLLDSKSLTQNQAGTDITIEASKSYLTIKEERLYNIINDKHSPNEHTLELIPAQPSLRVYTFTFG